MCPQSHASSTHTLLRLALPLMVAAILLLLGLGLAAAQGPSKLTRITVAAGTGDRFSGSPSLSADGTKIGFQSDSDFLGQGIPDDQYEIWLYDTATMTVTRVTTAAGAGNRLSWFPSLSADGTKIAFHSDSDFLGQSILDGQDEIWLYDTVTMTVTRVTTAAGAGSRNSRFPSLSADGTKIGFQSDSDFLGQGITVTQSEIWLYDTATMTVTQVTTSSDGAVRVSSSPSLSADGTKIAFRSDSDFLGQSIPYGQREIWLYDTATMTVTRVTTASASNRNSLSPSLGGDGTKIGFQSDSDFLGQGIPDEQSEIWLYDTATMTVTRVTTAAGAGDRDSSDPSLSADGTKIGFGSDSDFLGQSIPDEQQEVWLYDTATMTVTRVTTASASNRNSWSPSLSADGTEIALYSDSDFLGQSIPQNQYEIWLWEALPGLQLTKAADDSAPKPGQQIEYTIVVCNHGMAGATGAVVSDTLDERLGFIGPVTLDPPGAGTAGEPPQLATDLTISARGRITLTFSARVTTTGVTSGTMIANTAAVTSTEVSTPVVGGVSVTIGPAEVYLPVVMRSGS